MDILDNIWPASKHGTVLVTTRDRTLWSTPIDQGLEINEVKLEEGTAFLMQAANMRTKVDDELVAAQETIAKLGGLPLAITQMSALINAHSWSFSQFNEVYEEKSKILHREKRPGWSYPGYSESLDTVWELSFASLSKNARTLLGFVSLLSPDSVPTRLFSPSVVALPTPLSFCSDKLEYVYQIQARS
jgi:hypothetical protein